jgi:hypothetical protein
LTGSSIARGDVWLCHNGSSQWMAAGLKIKMRADSSCNDHYLPRNSMLRSHSMGAIAPHVFTLCSYMGIIRFSQEKRANAGLAPAWSVLNQTYIFKSLLFLSPRIASRPRLLTGLYVFFQHAFRDWSFLAKLSCLQARGSLFAIVQHRVV